MQRKCTRKLTCQEECPHYDVCGGCNGQCAFQTCHRNCGGCPAICLDRDDVAVRLQEVGHVLTLSDLKLRSQSYTPMDPFFPQITVAPPMPNLFDNDPTVAIGINRLYTSKGQLCEHVIDESLGKLWKLIKYYDVKPPRLLLLGTGYDDYLDTLWRHRDPLYYEGVRHQFTIFTALNFSVYHDHPRFEHLYNIRRSWLTQQQGQSDLYRIHHVIPFVGWFRPIDLDRQMALCRAFRILNFAMNAQTVRDTVGWAHFTAGVEYVERGMWNYEKNISGNAILFVGVSSPAKIRQLRKLSWSCSFTTATPHIAALKHELISIGLDYRQSRVKSNDPPDMLLWQTLANYRHLIYRIDLEIHAEHPHYRVYERYAHVPYRIV